MLGVIDYHDTLIAGPTVEPLDLDEVKKALKFAPTSEDTLINTWISAARQYFETQTDRHVIAVTRERAFDRPPTQAQIELPYPPLLSVLSVKYDDADGDEQTMDAAGYRVLTSAGPLASRGRVALVSGASWPSTLAHPQGLRIRYRCGYGEVPGDVPDLVKGVLFMLVGFFHRRGEDEKGPGAALPLSAETILRSFRQSSIGTLTTPRDAWAWVAPLSWP